MDENSLSPTEDEKTLQFWHEARNGKKRNYIYNYGKSKTCNHPELKEMVQGSNWYRCQECNYALFIMTAYQQPLHNVVLEGLMNAMHFSKEFGVQALQEVARRPIGQYDASQHKPVLPEGMDFIDVLNDLEEVDVNTADGGKRQLRGLQTAKWLGRGYLASGHARCLVGRKRHHYGKWNKEVCMFCKEPKEWPNGDSAKSLTNGGRDNREDSVPSLREATG